MSVGLWVQKYFSKKGMGENSCFGRHVLDQGLNEIDKTHQWDNGGADFVDERLGDLSILIYIRIDLELR
jgi:hypothetical protein